MNKNVITALSSISGAVVGSVVGTISGMIHAPLVAGMALTAPVSYPILGMSSAFMHMEGTTGEKLAVGACIGICMIPLAPLNLALSPFTPVIHAGVGAIAGGVGAGVLTHRSLNK